MNPIFSAVLVLGGIGALASVILVVAARLMYVPSHERTEAVEAVLPGANCGACGYAGCADYAAAVAEKGEETNLCVPGGSKVAAQVAGIMGTEAAAVEPVVAVVACHGSYDNTHDKYDYSGVESCAACEKMFRGRSVCEWGCLGFGDCVSVCKFDAISVKNGVAQTDFAKCTGCGACAARCPKGLIHLVPRTTQSFVVCSNKDRGAHTRKTCVRGCIGCKKCERNCPHGAVSVVDNCAVVDFTKCKDCGTCVVGCPTNALERETIDRA